MRTKMDILTFCESLQANLCVSRGYKPSSEQKLHMRLTDVSDRTRWGLPVCPSFLSCDSVGKGIKPDGKQSGGGQYHRKMLQGWPTKSQKRSDGHQSVLHWAVRAGRFHSRVSGLELWKQEESRWDHGVEPESPLPRTEQGAPQWISLKTGGQGSLGLTRDNIYPQNIPDGFVLFHLGKRFTRPPWKRPSH